MPSIAVTGASGFVARHLIPQLLAEGHEVRGIARSTPEGTHGETMSGFDFAQGDVRDPAAVQRTIEGSDYVIHLAASFSPEDRTADIIVRGTECVLSACAAAGVKRLVMLSCLGAGAASHSPFFEAKWRAETLVRGSEIPFAILRSSTIFGRGCLRPLAQTIRMLPVVPVPGNGAARVQPIDVADVVRCLIAAMTLEAVTGEIVALGGPSFLTFRQLVDLVAAEIGVQKPKVLVPWRILGTVAPRLPASARALYLEPAVGRFREGVVASPGIVERMFGFSASSVLPGIAGYIA